MALATRATVRKWLLRKFQPTVAFCCTKEADLLCQKNGLSFSELLAPFCDLSETLISTTSVGGNQYNLCDFSLRIVPLEQCRPVTENEADRRVVEAVTQCNSELEDAVPLEMKEDVKLFFRKHTNPTPWFDPFRSVSFENLRMSEQECFDHPIAVFTVVRSTETYATNKIDNLFNPSRPPPAYSNGIMDPGVMKFAVLLHDVSEGDLGKAEKNFRQVIQTQGALACKLLKINSVEEGASSGDQPDFIENRRTMFEGFAPRKGSREALKLLKPFGQCLSDEDIATLKQFVFEFTSKSLVPYMEKKVVILNDMVALAKKGVKNQLKAWWGKKKGGKGSSEPDGEKAIMAPTSQYNHTLIEMQVRKLADVAVLLQDFDLAAQTYRLVTNDFKNDKAWKHYAATQEMVGLCCFVLDDKKADLEACFDNAITSYGKSFAPRHVVRATTYLMDLLKSRGQWAESWRIAARTAKTAACLDAGFLYEQAAYLCLRSSSISMRRYAFYLMFAGVNYSKAYLRRHAIRCYTGALRVFRGVEWRFVEDHIFYQMALHHFFLSKIDVALNFFKKLMATSASGHQGAYLKLFAMMYSMHSEAGKTISIDLPRIDHQAVRATLLDYTAPTKSADTWREMELSVAKDIRVISPLTRKVCVAGELFHVDVPLVNQLGVQLPVDCLRLIVDNENVDCLESAVDLRAEQKKVLRLGVRALRKGTLFIRGISYRLCGVVPIEQEFVKGARRMGKKDMLSLNEEQEKEVIRGEGGKLYLPDQSMKLKVTSEMPLLSAEIVGIPTSLFHGEILKASIKMTNIGMQDLNNLRIKTNVPASVSFGALDDSHTNLPCAFGTSVSQHLVPSDGWSLDPSFLTVPLNGDTLKPGEVFELPIILRPRETGDQRFLFLFVYESREKNEDLTYRVVRITKQIMVDPSVSFDYSIQPSSTGADRYILSLECTNLTESTISLTEVGGLSPTWALSPLSYSIAALGKPNVARMFRVPPGQNSVLHFRVDLSEGADEHADPSTVRLSLSRLMFAAHPSMPTKRPPRPGEVQAEVPQQQVASSHDSSPHLSILLREKHQLWKHSLALMRASCGEKSTLRDLNVDEGHENRIRTSVEEEAKRIRKKQMEKEQKLFFVEPDCVDLMVKWELGEKVGQHNLCHLRFLSHRLHYRGTSEEVVEEAFSPVEFHIESPPSASFDFSRDELCLFAVDVDVRNASPYNVISFRFEVLTPQAERPKSDVSAGWEAEYFWGGNTEAMVYHLEPQHTHRLSLVVYILRPGVYNLTRFRVHVRDRQRQTSSVIYPSYQHWVTIHAAQGQPQQAAVRRPQHAPRKRAPQPHRKSLSAAPSLAPKSPVVPPPGKAAPVPSPGSRSSAPSAVPVSGGSVASPKSPSVASSSSAPPKGEQKQPAKPAPTPKPRSVAPAPLGHVSEPSSTGSSKPKAVPSRAAPPAPSHVAPSSAASTSSNDVSSAPSASPASGSPRRPSSVSPSTAGPSSAPVAAPPEAPPSSAGSTSAAHRFPPARRPSSAAPSPAPGSGSTTGGAGVASASVAVAASPPAHLASHPPSRPVTPASLSGAPQSRKPSSASSAPGPPPSLHPPHAGAAAAGSAIDPAVAAGVRSRSSGSLPIPRAGAAGSVGNEKEKQLPGQSGSTSSSAATATTPPSSPVSLPPPSPPPSLSGRHKSAGGAVQRPGRPSLRRSSSALVPPR